MHGQHCTSAHSIVTGAYVLPTHFSVDVDKDRIPTRLGTTHVTHVTRELIGIALTGPQFNPRRIIERLVDIIKTFELIIPEHWDVIFNKLGCYRSGQLRPQWLI